LKKVFLLVLCCGFFSPVKVGAQSETEFTQFGKLTFNWLTDTSESYVVEFIRIRTWLDLIERQNWNANEKEKRKLEINENYETYYKDYFGKTNLVIEQNQQEIIKGANFEMLSFSYTKAPEKTDLYLGTMRVLFKTEDVRNMITYRFQFFYNGKGFGLVTAPDEDF
jgi:hypothetical protein